MKLCINFAASREIVRGGMIVFLVFFTMGTAVFAQAPSSAGYIPQPGTYAANMSAPSETLDLNQKFQEADGYFQNKRFNDAERVYQSILSLAEQNGGPAYVTAAHRLGLIARKRQQYQKAQDYFVQAIRADGTKNPVITFDYAQILFDSGEYVRAEKLFCYLYSKHYNLQNTGYYYGMSLLCQQKYEESYSILIESLGQEKTCRMILEQAEMAKDTVIAAEMHRILEEIDLNRDQAFFMEGAPTVSGDIPVRWPGKRESSNAPIFAGSAPLQPEAVVLEEKPFLPPVEKENTADSLRAAAPSASDADWASTDSTEDFNVNLPESAVSEAESEYIIDPLAGTSPMISRTVDAVPYVIPAVKAAETAAIKPESKSTLEDTATVKIQSAETEESPISFAANDKTDTGLKVKAADSENLKITKTVGTVIKPEVSLNPVSVSETAAVTPLPSEPEPAIESITLETAAKPEGSTGWLTGTAPLTVVPADETAFSETASSDEPVFDEISAPAEEKAVAAALPSDRPAMKAYGSASNQTAVAESNQEPVLSEEGFAVSGTRQAARGNLGFDSANPVLASSDEAGFASTANFTPAVQEPTASELLLPALGALLNTSDSASQAESALTASPVVENTVVENTVPESPAVPEMPDFSSVSVENFMSNLSENETVPESPVSISLSDGANPALIPPVADETDFSQLVVDEIPGNSIPSITFSPAAANPGETSSLIDEEPLDHLFEPAGEPQTADNLPEVQNQAVHTDLPSLAQLTQDPAAMNLCEFPIFPQMTYFQPVEQVALRPEIPFNGEIKSENQEDYSLITGSEQANSSASSAVMGRTRRTPEENLAEAIAAGATVEELTPEEYQHELATRAGEMVRSANEEIQSIRASHQLDRR